jgi:hypothetical protein
VPGVLAADEATEEEMASIATEHRTSLYKRILIQVRLIVEICVS